jgi:hypothetical protein
MLSAQHSKKIDVYLVHDLQQINFNQRSRKISLRHKTKNDSRDLKIDNKRTNIFFFDVFYVSKYFLNLINFDQLNEIRCFISYKLSSFTIEDQNIIIKKRVNNVFFLSCESMWITTSLSHLSSTISSRRSSNRSSMIFQSTKKFWAYNLFY